MIGDNKVKDSRGGRLLSEISPCVSKRSVPHTEASMQRGWWQWLAMVCVVACVCFLVCGERTKNKEENEIMNAPFLPSSIVKAEHRLDLRRKVLSTTCERAYWQINLHKRDIFWLWNNPSGRVDVSTSDMIDMNECGLKIETSNPSVGKCVSWERCHFEGAYKGERKLNLMVAIGANRN
jgi:hypothetical protein